MALTTELRYAVRSLVKSPAFTVAAIVCLALAIGANTAIFTMVNAILLRPLPYADPAGLVMLWERNAHRPEGHNTVSPADYLDWGARARSFRSTAAYAEGRVTVTGVGEPIKVPALYGTASLLPTIGVTPLAGRGFSAAEDAPGGDPVVMLGETFWRTHFQGDRRVLGRSLSVDGHPTTIVGVVPAGYSLPGAEPALWQPLQLNPARDYRTGAGRFLRSVARLNTGVTPAAADAEIRAIAADLEREHTTFNAGWTAVVVPLREQMIGAARRPLLVLLGVVALVLLIACANVANLQLARAASRRREFAVRTALGASRWRVVRGVLIESLVLSVAGGGLGLLLAVWGTAALVAVAPDALPRAATIAMDGSTLVFTMALSLLTGVVFGLVPALYGARGEVHDVLKEGGRGSVGGNVRGGLVSAQLALSLMLLIGAGLLVRSFAHLTREDPGFEPAGVLTAKIDLPESAYPNDTVRVEFFRSLLARIRSAPTVSDASAITWLPFSGNIAATDYFVEGRPAPASGEAPVADILAVDPAYFRTLRIPFVRGEAFTERDAGGARKAIVINEALARAVFRGEDPIGRRVHMPWGDTLVGEIVGVARDTRAAGLDSVAKPTIYWAVAQFPSSFMTLVVRSRSDPQSAAPAVRSALRALDPGIPFADVRPLADYVGESIAVRRFTMLLLGAFAAVALVLAAVGISGVIANTVAMRTREIGVRMALGAGERDVTRMVVSQGMRLAVVGIAVGLGGAFLLSRVLQSLLYGVTSTDAVTYGGVAALVASVAVVAAYLPARRAARIDPMAALRTD